MNPLLLLKYHWELFSNLPASRILFSSEEITESLRTDDGDSAKTIPAIKVQTNPLPLTAINEELLRFKALVAGSPRFYCKTVEIRADSRLITTGCDGVAVSTVGCGPAGPGSSPGHGPIRFTCRGTLRQSHAPSSLPLLIGILRYFLRHRQRETFSQPH